MKIHLPATVTSAAILVAVGAIAGAVASRKTPSDRNSPSCDGEYADTLQLAGARVRQIEMGPQSAYTFLVRSSARYECPYFGSNGKLLRKRVDVVEHGTAFAYEVSGNETFLLTNEHVATWPEVTDVGHRVDGVAEGCKRVEQKLRIVHDDHDDYEPGHVALTPVAIDPLLDAAILKTTQPLAALPYHVGKSSALRQGNAVQVRGFPLGLIHAVNTGKVVNPYDLDQEQGWNHVDFVVDALLSEGNSGSPVLALSCQTGELQLVGMYHAGYKGASALNVVIGIDQLREFMSRKKRVVRAASEGGPAASATERRRLRDLLTAGTLPLFEFGGLHVGVETSQGGFLYHVYEHDFPIDDRRMAILQDDGGSGIGTANSGLWVRGESGWRHWPSVGLGPDDRDLLDRVTDAMRMHMMRIADYRHAVSAASRPEERRRGRELFRYIERHGVVGREMATELTGLSERLAGVRETSPVAAVQAPATPPTAPIMRSPGLPGAAP